MNILAARTLALGLVVASLAAGCRSAAGLSADEVVARNVAARGGLEAWHNVQTMVWTGHVVSSHAPMPSMQFELQQKRPNKTRLQINAAGDTSVRVFDGMRGWKLRSSRGQPQAEPYAPAEMKYAQAGHGIDGPLFDLAAKGNSVTLESVDEIGDRQAYHLNVRLQDGNEHVWVDTRTFLEIRDDRMAESPGGTTHRVSVTYGDYRKVEGLQIPFLIETGGAPGTTPDRMQIEKVALNVPLDDSAFEDRAPPRAHQRRLPSFAPRAPAQAVVPNVPTAANEGRRSAHP